MAYSNWGENVANSFMGMYQLNQQKKIENKRLGMEQEKIAIEREKAADARRLTDANLAQFKMAEEDRQRSIDFNNANMLPFDMDGDGVKELTVSPEFAERISPYAYSPFSTPTFNNGQVGTETKYFQNNTSAQNIGLLGTVFGTQASMWDNAQNRANSTRNTQISAAASANALDLQRQQITLENRQTATQKLGEYMATIDWRPTVSQEGDMIDTLMFNYGIPYQDAVNMVEAAKNSRPRGGTGNNNGTSGVVVQPNANGKYSGFNSNWAYKNTLIGQ